MFSWGYNSNGELGIGNTSNQTVPKEVSLKGVVTKVIMSYCRYTYDIQLICKLYTLPHGMYLCEPDILLPHILAFPIVSLCTHTYVHSYSVTYLHATFIPFSKNILHLVW